MSNVDIPGLRDYYISTENIPLLEKSGIYRIGHTVTYDISYKRPLDTAKHILVLITASGEGEVLVNGMWHRITPNTAYIVPIGADWRWRYNAETEKIWEQFYVVLQPNFRFSIPREQKTAYILRDCDPTDLLVNFKQLYKASLSKERSTIMTHIAEIMVCLVGEILDDKQHHYQLNKLWMIISHNLAHSWNIASLCDEMAMCPEKLRLLCNLETGRSPMAQVYYLRMRYACDLLRQARLNVQQIGLLVGYQNPFNFSLAFKRNYGLSPSHYRKEQKLKGEISQS